MQCADCSILTSYIFIICLFFFCVKSHINFYVHINECVHLIMYSTLLSIECALYTFVQIVHLIILKWFSNLQNILINDYWLEGVRTIKIIASLQIENMILIELIARANRMLQFVEYWSCNPNKIHSLILCKRITLITYERGFLFHFFDLQLHII